MNQSSERTDRPPIVWARPLLEAGGVLVLVGMFLTSIAIYANAFFVDDRTPDGSAYIWDYLASFHLITVIGTIYGLSMIGAPRLFFRWRDDLRTPTVTVGVCFGVVTAGLSSLAMGGGALVAIAWALDDEKSTNAADALASCGYFVFSMAVVGMGLVVVRLVVGRSPDVPPPAPLD